MSISKFCAAYPCTREVVLGSDYCAKHLKQYRETAVRPTKNINRQWRREEKERSHRRKKRRRRGR